ncbi:hypothetical protein [Actinomadura miaoliensis]|uniref:Uncharacterized protein n=1 Tax=Actinomadura miaoliensis TaxID=430685 RepID=A0ABP7WAY6_9ACTN
MNIKDTGLRLVVTSALADIANADYKRARAEAEPLLAKAAAEDGIEKLSVRLPGGRKVATVTVKDGPVDIEVFEDVFLEWVATHMPNEVEEFIDPAAATDPDIVELVRQHRPDAVRRRVRPVWREARLKEAKENGGYVTDPATGEQTRIAELTYHEPTGAFILKSDADLREQVITAARNGALAGGRLSGLLARLQYRHDDQDHQGGEGGSGEAAP